VSLISSVSGGGFTAAYYALWGERIFSDFKPRFLKKRLVSQGQTVSCSRGFVSECSALREQYHFGVSSFGFLSSFVFRIFSLASLGAPANETAHYQTWHGTHMRFQRPACAPRRVEGVLKPRHWRGKGARRGDNAIQTGIGASQLNQTTK